MRSDEFGIPLYAFSFHQARRARSFNITLTRFKNKKAHCHYLRCWGLGSQAEVRSFIEGVDAGVGLGVSGSIYAGQTISDFGGSFDNASIGAGLGEYGSVVAYCDPNKPFSESSSCGVGARLGVSIAGAGSFARTDTTVIPLGSVGSGGAGGNGKGGVNGFLSCF